MPEAGENKVVILGLHVNGAAALRRLAALGYEVHGVTHDPAEGGMRSRHGIKHVGPHPMGRYDDWVGFMRDLGARIGGRAALIPTQDRYVLAMDKAAGDLAPLFRFDNFGSGLRTQLCAKRSTFALAARHGFPMPRTAIVNSRDDVLAFCRDATWPVLIKPDVSDQWRQPEVEAAIGYRKALTAPDALALADAFERVRAYSPDALAQEMIVGPDQNLLLWTGYVGADGRARGRVMHRPLRMFPVHFGQSTLAQLVDMPEIEAECGRWLGAIGYHGVCGIELKIDARDGKARLVEVNPRSVGNESFGLRVGVDMISQAVEGIFGREMEPHRPTHFRLKLLHLGNDLRALRQYRAEGSLTIVDWLRSLTPPIYVIDLPWREDLPYACGNLRNILGDVARAVLRHS